MDQYDTCIIKLRGNVRKTLCWITKQTTVKMSVHFKQISLVPTFLPTWKQKLTISLIHDVVDVLDTVKLEAK